MNQQTTISPPWKPIEDAVQAIDMRTFHKRVTEVTIEMDGLYITTVSSPDNNSKAAPNEAVVGDLRKGLFTAAEWQELASLIETAIREVTK